MCVVGIVVAFIKNPLVLVETESYVGRQTISAFRNKWLWLSDRKSNVVFIYITAHKTRLDIRLSSTHNFHSKFIKDLSVVVHMV